MLKFVDSGRFQIIRVQNFVEQIGLRHNFRDVCHRRDRSNLFSSSRCALYRTFSRQGRQALYRTSGHQTAVPWGRPPRGVISGANSCPISRGVLIGQCRIIVCVCVQLYISKILLYQTVKRKLRFIKGLFHGNFDLSTWLEKFTNFVLQVVRWNDEEKNSNCH